MLLELEFRVVAHPWSQYFADLSNEPVRSNGEAPTACLFPPCRRIIQLAAFRRSARKQRMVPAARILAGDGRRQPALHCVIGEYALGHGA